MMDDWFTPPDTPRATTLPESFQPKAQHRQLAAALGVDLDDVFPLFVDHHLSKGSKFKSWDRALNTWLRREQQFAIRNRPQDVEFSRSPEWPACPIGFCDGSGWFVDRATRKAMNCECRRAVS